MVGISKKLSSNPVAIIFMVTCSLIIVSAQSLPLWQFKVEPAVLRAAEDGETEFLVVLSEQPDLRGAENLRDKTEKGAYVQRKMVETARRTQGSIRAVLEQQGVEYRSYSIVNMLWVRGGWDVLQSLALQPEVEHVYLNPTVQLELPMPQDSQALESIPVDAWGIRKINADDVWAAGIIGHGVVIGGQDTGYDWTHPALKNQYRGWDGSSADHNYNWHDAIHTDIDPLPHQYNPCGYESPVPCDDNSHGTHTMGTMLGDDGADHQIGVAPGARWIGCRNMDENWGSPSTYIECYEWFIAPYPIGGTFEQGDPAKAPDIINNSWACTDAEGCSPSTPDILKAAVEAVRAAGILTVHSAGNSGNACGTINMPAAIYDASFTVGATESDDQIASFSSFGAVTVDGSNRLKPDVSAPGYAILSSIPLSMDLFDGNPDGYTLKYGTSMAAPHVAGLAALLISYDPNLRGQVDQLENYIAQTAIPRTHTMTCGGVSGSSIPNNSYGWGRADALQAFSAVFYQNISSTLYLPVSFKKSALP